MILEVLFLGVKVIVSSFPLIKKPIGEHFKENLRYNVIVTVYFSPRFCILGVKGREKQRGEGKTNDAKRDESGITRLLGVWAFHISSQLCSVGRTSPFWSHLRCLLVMFSSSGGELSQSLRAFLPIVGWQKSVYGERRWGRFWQWLQHLWGRCSFLTRAARKSHVYKMLSKSKTNTGDLI